MAGESAVSLDSGPCVVDKAFKCEMFWERFWHRQEPLTRGVRQSCTEDVLEPLHLEPKKLIMNYLGQADKAAKEEISEADDDLVRESPPHSSQEKEKLAPKRRWLWKREDTILQKHLCRTRQHIVAVKQGRGYFHLLQKEKQEAQEEQRRERQRREELRRSTLRPPTVCHSDEDSDTAEMWCDVAATSSSKWKPNGRKKKAVRPFTPVHRSLTSTPPHLLPSECVYRQLCCLNWLLEAMTLERSGRLRPVTSCWDAKDPGRSRTTIKKLNKEKAIEAKWEQFIAQPKQTRLLPSRQSHVSSGRHVTWKSSALSVLSSSVTGSSTDSLLSLAAAPQHTCDEPLHTEAIERESSSDPSSAEYFQRFLQEIYQRVHKSCCNSDEQLIYTADSDMSVKVHHVTEQNTAGEKAKSQGEKSTPARRSSASTKLMQEKEAMLGRMRASFVDKTEELTLQLSDALDRCAKTRWDFAVQRYRSLCHAVSRGRKLSAVTSMTSEASPRAADPKTPDITEDPYSTQWLSALLSDLTPIARSDRKVGHLLEKLGRFTAGHVLRLHPHHFLRVLNSLQPWEICCPDLCVAIEMVRQNVVKMPRSEYDSWIHSRLDQSQSSRSHTHSL